jgi:hypothetical protein
MKLHMKTRPECSDNAEILLSANCLILEQILKLTKIKVSYITVKYLLTVNPQFDNIPVWYRLHLDCVSSLYQHLYHAVTHMVMSINLEVYMQLASISSICV